MISIILDLSRSSMLWGFTALYMMLPSPGEIFILLKVSELRSDMTDWPWESFSSSIVVGVGQLLSLILESELSDTK